MSTSQEAVIFGWEGNRRSGVSPYAGSGEYCALDSFVDFDTVYIVCLFTSFAPPLILFSSLISLLIYPLPIFSFKNRPTPFPGRRS